MAIVVLSGILSAAALGAPAADPLEPARSAIRGKQFGRAVQELTAQAEHGSVDAKYLLGLAYLSGLDRKPEQSAALQWLRSAAQSGHPGAAFVLAGILCLSADTEAAAEGARWLEQAARSGYQLAQDAVAIAARGCRPERRR